MATASAPYVPAKPGDLITAENWNDMQLDVQQDISKQVAAAVAGVKDVDHAGDSDKIGGMSLADLTQYILNLAFAQLPKRTGYMQVFCNLEWTASTNTGVEKPIHHNLKSYPLVDVYRLNYFAGVCAKNDKPEDATAEMLLFYLYHADERRIRIPGNTGQGAGAVDIETDPKFRILWKTLLDQLQAEKLLDWTDDTTLDDLEVDFWQAMFKSPNDNFDPDSYCHSPWFEKCCGEKRSVGDLKKHGDFDDIYLKVKPQKTAFYVAPQQTTNVSSGDIVDRIGGVGTITGGGGTTTGSDFSGSDVMVSQLDFDSISLRLLLAPTFTFTQPANGPTFVPPPDAYTTHLPVMVLLKV